MNIEPVAAIGARSSTIGWWSRTPGLLPFGRITEEIRVGMCDALDPLRRQAARLAAPPSVTK